MSRGEKLRTSYDVLLTFGMKGKTAVCETPVCHQREVSVRIQGVLYLGKQSKSTLMVFSLQDLGIYFSFLALQIQVWDCALLGWVSLLTLHSRMWVLPHPLKRQPLDMVGCLMDPVYTSKIPAQYHLQVYWAHSLARGWMDGWITLYIPDTCYFTLFKEKKPHFFLQKSQTGIAPLCLSSSRISPYSEK